MNEFVGQFEDGRAEDDKLYHFDRKNHPYACVVFDKANSQVLSREEEVEVFKIYKKGGRDAYMARDLLIRANLRFVVRMAVKYFNKNREHGFIYADLFQQGCIGLMKAIENFDLEYGNRLISYATYWIEREMRDYILDTRADIRIPQYKFESIRKIIEEQRLSSCLTGVFPSVRELVDSSDIDLDPDEADWLMRVYEYPVSFDDPEENDEIMQDDLDESDMVGFDFWRAEIRDALDVAISRLDLEREMFVRMYYGYGWPCEEAYQQIADRVFITREACRTAVSESVDSLHKKMKFSGVVGGVEEGQLVAWLKYVAENREQYREDVYQWFLNRISPRDRMRMQHFKDNLLLDGGF